QVVLVKPGLLRFGVVFAAFGIQVFTVVALDVGRAVEVGDLAARIIAHGIGIDFHIGCAYDDVVAEISILRIVEIVSIPAGDGVGCIDDPAATGIRTYTAFHVIGEVVGGKYSV